MDTFGTEYITKFDDWKANMAKLAEKLSLGEQYDDTHVSQFSFSPSFSGESPSYEVNTIDKDVELYTLKEALSTEGIGDVYCSLLFSPLLPQPKKIFDAILRSRIETGLFCYVQPKINEKGESIEQQIDITTSIREKGAADMLVIVVKTGAKIRFTQHYKNGNDTSLLGRMMVVVLEEDASLHLSEYVEGCAGAISVERVYLLGQSSHIAAHSFSDAGVLLKETEEAYLLGEGASFHGAHGYVAKKDAHYDIGSFVFHKHGGCLSNVETACAAKDGGKIIYRSKTIPSESDVGNGDELRTYSAGSDSYCALPVMNAPLFRDEKNVHEEVYSVDHARAVLGDIIGDKQLQEKIKQSLSK